MEFWYDGVNGNDANAGTELSPRKTLGSATVDTATGVGTPTDLIVNIKRGTTVNMSSSLSCYGTLIVRPYGAGSEWPVLDKTALGDYQMVCGYSSAADEVMLWTGIKVVDYAGSTLTNGIANASGGSGALHILDCLIDGFASGVGLVSGDGHLVLRNRIVNWRNNGLHADAIGYAPNDVRIEGNYLDGRIDSGGVGTNDAITLHSATLGFDAAHGLRNVIRNNTVVAGTESCIEVALQWQGAIVEDNTLYSRQDGTSTSWSDVGIQGPGTIFRNNRVFARYRYAIDVFPQATGAIVENNEIIREVAAAQPFIRLQAVTAPSIISNLFVGVAGQTGAWITGLNSITLPFAIKNNVYVNYSAGATWFVGAQTSADIDTWDIDGNVYVQMPGSIANAWRNSSGACTWAQWKARPGTPDASSIDPLTTLPCEIPTYSVVGGARDPAQQFGITSTSPLLGVGVDIGYRRDARGIQRRKPPSAGPHELPTHRRRLDSDPASW